MSLPFTADAFFDVFARYNTALLPAVLVWWALAGWAVAAVLVRPGPATDRGAVAVLVGLWLWGGLVYHAGYFTAINPAAWLFAALFVVQAVELARVGLVRHGLQFGTASGGRRAIGVALALYALLYPFIAVAGGHAYPAAPTFGVPCPTDLLTIGLLVTAARPPLSVLAVPWIWALIGGSAALVLGVAADYALLVSAVVLVAVAIASRRPVTD
ncbi:MAG: DUF6064 family protein [Dehalococcoidia bacterium]